MKPVIALALWLLLAGMPAFAAVEVHEFDDPVQEARYKKLIAELRCLVCQNQNLADSNAELAQDLRNKTYEMVRAGQSDEDIIGYMVQRYGDFVLYRPPLKATTVLLWLKEVLRTPRCTSTPWPGFSSPLRCWSRGS